MYYFINTFYQEEKTDTDGDAKKRIALPGFRTVDLYNKTMIMMFAFDTIIPLTFQSILTSDHRIENSCISSLDTQF